MQTNLVIFHENSKEDEIFKFMDYAAMSLGSNTGAKVSINKGQRCVTSECKTIRFYFINRY